MINAAPDRLLVEWTYADQDTMPATVSAHTHKSRVFAAPEVVGAERVEYSRVRAGASIPDLTAAPAPDVAGLVAKIKAIRSEIKDYIAEDGGTLPLEIAIEHCDELLAQIGGPHE